jgi:YgiT-type zinc finger domain-containing protein
VKMVWAEMDFRLDCSSLKEWWGKGQPDKEEYLFIQEVLQMSFDAHDCCHCAGKMRVCRHDFMARVGDEIVVIKDVPGLICDTCGEVEYTLEVSREIDVMMKEFFAGRLLAKPLAAWWIAFKPQHADSNSLSIAC